MQGIFVIQFKYRSRERSIVILIPRDSSYIYLHIDISYNTFSQSENTVICLAMLNNLQSNWSFLVLTEKFDLAQHFVTMIWRESVQSRKIMQQ